MERRCLQLRPSQEDFEDSEFIQCILRGNGKQIVKTSFGKRVYESIQVSSLFTFATRCVLSPRVFHRLFNLE